MCGRNKAHFQRSTSHLKVIKSLMLKRAFRSTYWYSANLSSALRLHAVVKRSRRKEPHSPNYLSTFPIVGAQSTLDCSHYIFELPLSDLRTRGLSFEYLMRSNYNSILYAEKLLCKNQEDKIIPHFKASQE